MKLRVTPALNGTLGEAYYKEGCDQHGWAYISLEKIHNDMSSQFKDNRILVFKKGFHRIRVKIPELLMSEIKDISRPTNDSIENPRHVFDYLACRVGQKEVYDSVVLADPSRLCWAEVKTGNSDFSNNQVAAMKKIRLELALFYIEDVYELPENIVIDWVKYDSNRWIRELDKIEEEDEGRARKNRYDDRYYRE